MKTLEKNNENNVADFISYKESKIKEQKKTKYISLVFLCALLSTIIGLLTWCKYGTLEESVPGIGQFMPEQKIRRVMSPTSGIVSKVFVKEDQLVKKGQVIAVLDPELSEINQEGISSQIGLLSEEINAVNDAFRNASARHSYSASTNAWVNATQNEYQARLKSANMLINKSKEEYQESVQNYSKIKNVLNSSENVLGKYKTLYNKGGIAQNQVIEYEKQVINQRGELASAEADIMAKKAALEQSKSIPDQVKGSYQKDLMDRVTNTRKDLLELQNQVLRNNFAIKHEVITAPIDGIINEQIIRGNGEAVNAGEVLLSLIPVNTKPVAEIKVSNRDLAYIHLNQRVILKIEAMPYQKFGKLYGKVTSLSPSTLSDKEGKPYYLVRVKPEKDFLTNAQGEKHYIKSGMTVSADFFTRKRNIIEFITEPVESTIDKAFKDPSSR